jgi:hypothetical protein
MLFAALSGGGKALASSAQDEQRLADQKSLEAERARLEEEKALRIDEARRVRDRQGAVQMGQDITKTTAQLQNERDAAAINAANGSSMSAADAEVLRNNPEARKAYGLLGATRQTDLEDRATAAEKLGYMDAAEGSRRQLQTEIGNQRNQKLDENADAARKDEKEWRQQQAALANKREDRMANLAAAELALRKASLAKADSRESGMAEREARMATVAALRGAEAEVKLLAKEAADPMLAPEQKAVVMEQLEAARRETKQYRSALASAGLDGSKTPDKPFNPADFSLGGSKGGDAGKTQRVANPMDSGYVHEPAKLKSTTRSAAPATPRDQAINALDLALQETGRKMAAANSAGDRAEIARLSTLFAQQNAAKQRAQRQ